MNEEYMKEQEFILDMFNKTRNWYPENTTNFTEEQVNLIKEWFKAGFYAGRQFEFMNNTKNN